MDLNPTIASLEPPAGQGERAWRKHLSHPAGIPTVLPRLGLELLRQQLQGIAFRPFQALGLSCQRRSDPFLPPQLEGGEGSAGNLGTLTQVWTRSAEPGQDPVCQWLDPWRRGQGALSSSSCSWGHCLCWKEKGNSPETFPGIPRECLCPWVGEPALRGISLMGDFTSQPFDSHQILQGRGEPSAPDSDGSFHLCHSRPG